MTESSKTILNYFHHDGPNSDLDGRLGALENKFAYINEHFEQEFERLEEFQDVRLKDIEKHFTQSRKERLQYIHLMPIIIRRKTLSENSDDWNFFLPMEAFIKKYIQKQKYSEYLIIKEKFHGTKEMPLFPNQEEEELFFKEFELFCKSVVFEDLIQGLF